MIGGIRRNAKPVIDGVGCAHDIFDVFRIGKNEADFTAIFLHGTVGRVVHLKHEFRTGGNELRQPRFQHLTTETRNVGGKKLPVPRAGNPSS